MKTLILMMILALPATAQRKLWTWTSPSAADAEVVGVLHAAATDSKGNAALVVGEFKFDWDSPFRSKDCQFRLLWISAAGRVIHEQVIPVENVSAAAMANGVAGQHAWSVINVSPTAWIVTDSRTIYSCSLKGKAKVASQTQVPEGEIAFAANATSAFAGWFQQRPGPAGSFFFGSDVITYAHTAELSLWSLK